jgi:hypothetical protein
LTFPKWGIILSDHDAQLITLLTYNSRPPSKKYRLIRNINDHMINDFFTKLSYETWDIIFSTDDVNIMFNSFLDTYLKMFYCSFPLKRAHINKKHKNWITLGILTFCRHKRELFTACRNNYNPDLLKHYKSHYKILSALIKEAKKLNYADKIKKSSNKNKTIWNIVNLESNKTGNMDKINTLNINGIPISECQKMANEFNKYFLTIAKSINSKQNELSPYNADNTTPLHYLTHSFTNPFPNINLKSVSTKEIKNIIKSLNLKNSSGYNEYLPSC